MEINPADYKTEINLRIDWSDIDLLGHVNNISYFRYIQASRVNYLEMIGFMDLYQFNNTGPLLASTSCQFIKPLFFPGNIKVMSKVDFIKNSSFGLNHIILNEQDEIVASAIDIIVLYDFNTNHKLTIPAETRNIIQNNL